MLHCASIHTPLNNLDNTKLERQTKGATAAVHLRRPGIFGRASSRFIIVEGAR